MYQGAFEDPRGLDFRNWADQTLGPGTWGAVSIARCAQERKPSVDEWQTCAIKWLFPLIREAKPEVVVALGADAMTVLTGKSGVRGNLGKVLGIGDYRVMILEHPRSAERTDDGPARWRAQATLLPGLLKAKTFGAKLGSYRLLSLPEAVARALGEIPPEVPVGYDYETTGLDPWVEDLICVAVSVKARSAFSIDLTIPANRTLWTGWLKANAVGRLVPFNAGFENLWDRVKLGVETVAYQDAWLQVRCQDENQPSKLKTVAGLLFPESMGYDRNIEFRPGVKYTAADLWEYNCTDADLTLRISEKLPKHPKEDAINSAIVTDLRITGMAVDLDALKDFGKTLRSTMFTAVSHLRSHQDYVGWERAGGVLTSADAVSDLLFNRLRLPILDTTPSGAPSTEQAVLKKLTKHSPIPQLILDWREAFKQVSTYTESLPKFVRADGRIHPDWSYGRTSTWRLACSDPNLQNQTDDPALRNAFVAKPGHVLVSLDFSQMELRILAALSGDEGMLAAYREGRDLHTETAAAIAGCPVAEVSKAMRDRAKTINFGIIYGMSEGVLAERLSLSLEDAKVLLTKFWEIRPGVRAFLDRCIAQARDQGFVETPFGRKRLLPLAATGSARERGHAANQACNFPIQCSAADITFAAMRNTRGVATLVAQVHDELIFEVPEAEALDTAMRLKNIMTQAYLPGSDLVFAVDAAIGPRWGSLIDVK